MKSRRLIELTAALCALCAVVCGQQPQPEAQPAADVRALASAQEHIYKTVGTTKLSLFVFAPAGQQRGARRAAIVFFSGGGWNNGNVKQFAKHSEYLAGRGMVAIVADYRVRSRQGVTPFECVSDAKSAMRWVRTHADELGVDPQRIAAGGGSAGGHLAAATALIPILDEPHEDRKVSSQPNALILFNPALDLVNLNLGRSLGEKVKEISPMQHVRKGAPPTIIFHGTGDATVPFAQAEAFCAAMKQQGNRCELMSFADRAHGFFNYGRGDGADYKITLRATDEFLRSLKYLP
jgi:acetyl esterase